MEAGSEPQADALQLSPARVFLAKHAGPIFGGTVALVGVVVAGLVTIIAVFLADVVGRIGELEKGRSSFALKEEMQAEMTNLREEMGGLQGTIDAWADGLDYELCKPLPDFSWDFGTRVCTGPKGVLETNPVFGSKLP